MAHRTMTGNVMHTTLRPLCICLDVSRLSRLIDKFGSWPFFWGVQLHLSKCYLRFPQLLVTPKMSSGPSRNIPRRRRAQTPFYPPAETRHRPSASGLRAHDVIEIISDDEATGQASVEVHHDPIVSYLIFLVPGTSLKIITHSPRSPLKMWLKYCPTTKTFSKLATSR